MRNHCLSWRTLLEHALRNGDKYVFNLNKEEYLQRSYLSEKNEEGTMIPLNFKNGADRIARDLGFTSRRELEKWATSNPERWGNKYGGSLFYDENAFNEKGNHYTPDNNRYLVAERGRSDRKTECSRKSQSRTV